MLAPQPTPHPERAHRTSQPRKPPIHGRMLLCRGLLLRTATKAGPSRPKEEAVASRLRDPAHARSRAARGAPGRDHRARSRADRERRRHLGRPRPLGPAQARVRDRQEDGRDLPPAPVRRRAGDARRAVADPQDHGRRHAPPPDAPHQGRTRPRPPRPRAGRDGASREPEYAAANIRSQEEPHEEQ